MMAGKNRLEVGEVYDAVIGKNEIRAKYFGILSRRNLQRTHVILSVINDKVKAFRFSDEEFKFEDGELKIENHDYRHLKSYEINYLIWLAGTKGRTLNQFVNERIPK